MWQFRQGIIKNNFRRNENLNIVCAFDNDSALVGTTINGLLVHDMSELEAFVRQEGHGSHFYSTKSPCPKAIDKIVQAGVTAILNFAPDRVSVPANVSVQYIDLTTELQTLIYFNETFSLANSPKQ